MRSDAQPTVQRMIVGGERFAGAIVDDASSLEDDRIPGDRQDPTGMLLDQDQRIGAFRSVKGRRVAVDHGQVPFFT